MKPETLFRGRLLPLLKKVPRSHWLTIQQSSIHGTPDILGVVNGRFVALEIKASKRSPRTALQEYNLKMISEKALGYAAFVYPENLDEIFADLLKISTGEPMDVLAQYMVKIFNCKTHQPAKARQK